MINRQLNYGREHIASFAKTELQKLNGSQQDNAPLSVLDIGAGSGTDLFNIREALNGNAQLFAIENNPKNVNNLKAKGINVASIDIERDVFPYPESFFDIVCANQILEHTKELFWITSEVSRVLKRPAYTPPQRKLYTQHLSATICWRSVFDGCT